MRFRVYTTISGVLFLLHLTVGGGNLIGNPSFEERGADGAPAGWLRYRLEPEQVAYGEGMAHDGRFGVGIRDKKDKSAAGWIAEEFIRVEPGKQYRLSGWIRTENAWGGNAVSASLHTLQNGRPKWLASIYTPEVNGNRPWTRVEQVFTVPEGAVLVKVGAMRRHAAPGTAWFDDLALEACLPEGGAPAPSAAPRFDWSRALAAEPLRPGKPVREQELPVSGWTKLEPSGGGLEAADGVLSIADTALPGVGWFSPAFKVEPGNVYGLEATVRIRRAWHVRLAALLFGEDGAVREIRWGEARSGESDDVRETLSVRPADGVREIRFAVIQSRSSGRSEFEHLIFRCFEGQMNE